MLKKSQSSTSEFANNALTTNMVKVGNYHRKSIDRVSTIFSDYDGIQQVIPFSSLERFQQFQAVKNGNAPLQYKPTLPVHYNTVQTERDVIVILNDHELTHLPSDALKNKTKVKTMDISQNKFSEFPMPVLQLTLLTSLRLDYNQLKAIPSEICRLVNLEYLTMSNNLIDKLPPTFTKLEKLKHLDLEGNGFTILSPEITGLKNLECLNIVHNRFRTFSCGFKDLVRLVEFHFEWFRYTTPQLHIHQKRKDGEYNINKLRSKCGELHAKKISAMNFEDFVKVMSYEKVDLSSKDACGRTALHTAGVYGDRNVAEFLVTNYPQLIDEEDQDGMTALCLSLFGDKYSVTEYLIRKTANIKIGGGKHGSVLHIATKRRNLDAVKEIIKLGEDPNKLDAGGNSPLHYAFTALIDGHINAGGVIQHLLDNGADPNIKNRENWSPVHMAVRKKNFAAIEWILSYNFEVQEIHGRGDIFKLNKQGGVYLWTSYHIATYSDSYEIVNALGEAKINPFKRSLNGFTAKRIVKKYGLTLKLVEKFEKEWVKQNILSKSAQAQKEGAVHLSLYNLNSAKEGNNASKNIFRDLMLGIKNHPNITTSDTTGFGYMLKPRMNVMRSTYSAVRPKKATDDSFEVEPEPDTDFDPENQNSDVVYMDYCSEINEEGQDCLSMLRAQDSNIKTNKLPEGPPHQMKQFIKGKTDFTSNFQPVNLDLEAYEEKLENQGQFTIEFLSEEIKLLQENLVSSRVLVYEKMKILNAFKMLHRAIINHVYRSFDVPIEEDLLPFYIHDYNTNIAPEQKVCPLKATMAQISSLYELVPQALIEIFKDMPNKINEGFHLKKRICNALDDYKYFPAIAFLENLIDSPSENALVVREAGGCYKGIKAYFDSERHQEESREAYHRFLKRLYSKRPSTKKYLSPLMQLEKDI